MDKYTHFGFQKVPWADKASRVAGVFDSVAGKYDLMNDLMSAGVHRAWKRFALEVAAVRPGQQVLDVAAGTGDMSLHFARRVGSRGQVIMTDINGSMLGTGRDRILDRGHANNIGFVLCDAEKLPFPDASFDRTCIAFGLRNVTDKAAALSEMTRILRPGGRLLILEFSKPVSPLLEKAYDQYSFHVLPALGQAVAGDSESYRYLAESIRMHPDQETLLDMLGDAGLSNCRYHNMTGGIVACHTGIRA